jgi:hypothetical protein
VISTLVQCGSCGAQRGQSNHWFMSKVSHSTLQIRAFDLQDAINLNFKPLCGERCVSKEVSFNLNGLVTARTETRDASQDVLEPVLA